MRCLLIPSIALLLFLPQSVRSEGEGTDGPIASASLIKSRFPKAGGMIKGAFVDLKDGRITAKYNSIADSGVELERTDSHGEAVWRVLIEGLGVAHKKYSQEVVIDIDEEKGVVWAISLGAKRIYEVRKISDGSQVSREVTEITR